MRVTEGLQVASERGLGFKRQGNEIIEVSGVHGSSIEGRSTLCHFTITSIKGGALDKETVSKLQLLDLNARHGLDIMSKLSTLIESHPDLKLTYQTENGLNFEHFDLQQFVLNEHQALGATLTNGFEQDISGAISWYHAFTPTIQTDLTRRFGHKMVMLALDGNNFGALNDAGQSELIDQNIIKNLRDNLRTHIKESWIALGLPTAEFDCELFRKGGDEFFLILKSINDPRSIEAALAGVKSFNDHITSIIAHSCDPAILANLHKFAKIKQSATDISKELCAKHKNIECIDDALTQQLHGQPESALPLHQKLMYLATQRAANSKLRNIPGSFDFGAIYSGDDAQIIGPTLDALGFITLLALCDVQQYNAKKSAASLPIADQAREIHAFSKSKIDWIARRSSDLVEVSTLMAHQSIVAQELDQALEIPLDARYSSLTLTKRRILAQRGSDTLIDTARASEMTLGELLGPFTAPFEATLIFDEPANFGAFNKVLKDAARANLIVEERAHSVINAASDEALQPLLLLKHGASGIIRLLPRIEQSETEIAHRIRRLPHTPLSIHTQQTFSDQKVRSQFDLEIALRNGLAELKSQLGLTTQSTIKSDKLVVKHLQVTPATKLSDLQTLCTQAV